MKNKEKHHNIDMVALRIKFHLAWHNHITVMFGCPTLQA